MHRMDTFGNLKHVLFLVFGPIRDKSNITRINNFISKRVEINSCRGVKPFLDSEYQFLRPETS